MKTKFEIPGLIDAVSEKFPVESVFLEYVQFMKVLLIVISVLFYIACVQDSIEPPVTENPGTPKDSVAHPEDSIPLPEDSVPQPIDTVHHSVAGAPTLLSPSQGLQNAPRVTTLTWAWSEGSPPWAYRIQLSTDALFRTFLLNARFIGSPFLNRGGLTPTTKYYWRVRVEKNDIVGPWSGTGWFLTESAPVVLEPGWTQVRYPTGGAVDVPLEPRLQWIRADRATSYRVQFGTDSTFSSLQKDTTLADTSIAVGTLVHLGTYHWRVRSENTHGVSPWVTADFKAFEGYQVFNRGKTGDEWIYYANEDGSKRIRKYSLQGSTNFGDRTKFSFVISESVCGNDTTAIDLSDSTCFSGHSPQEATIVWGVDSALTFYRGFPLYFTNLFHDYLSSARIHTRLEWNGSPHALLKQTQTGSVITSVTAHYVENVGMIQFNYYQLKPSSTQYYYRLLTFNGKVIPSDSLAALLP